MRPLTNKSLCFGILGFFLVALGGSLCFLRPTIFHQILQNGLALSPVSKSFNVWQDTSSLPPMYMKVYLFNWTNPREFRRKKPHFEQVGPYAFREIRQKDNVTFHHENKTVSYLLRRTWYFDAERSNGSLSDVISSLDVVAATAAHKIRYWEYEWQKSLSYLLSARQVYHTKTVDELLFKGYADTLLTMGRMMVEEDVPAYDRFGWFYLRNGTTDMDGHFNMETGEDDISQLGIIRNWNYKDTMKILKSPCNIVEGSAGEFWPPSRTKDEITLFSSELCRPLIYEYEETVSHLGIEGYRYAIDNKTLGNSTRRRFPHEQAKFFEPTTTTEDFFAAEHSSGEDIGFSTSMKSISDHSFDDTDEYSDNDPDIVNMGHCYCDGECVPSGLINISACRYGSPAFISLPHFYKTDPVILNQIEGMKPDAEDHSFYIILEPTTGIPLKVSARLQLNILLQSSETVTMFNNISRIFMPMAWFSLDVEITEELASQLRLLLTFPDIMLYTGVAMIIIGLCLISTIALLYLKQKRRIPPTDITEKVEKAIDEPSEKKSEMMYMDKMSGGEDSNVRSDRRLYAKLY